MWLNNNYQEKHTWASAGHDYSFTIMMFWTWMILQGSPLCNSSSPHHRFTLNQVQETRHMRKYLCRAKKHEPAYQVNFLRAFFWPGFFRSTDRGSRISKPSAVYTYKLRQLLKILQILLGGVINSPFLKGASYESDNASIALLRPSLIAPAWPVADSSCARSAPNMLANTLVW